MSMDINNALGNTTPESECRYMCVCVYQANYKCACYNYYVHVYICDVSFKQFFKGCIKRLRMYVVKIIWLVSSLYIGESREFPGEGHASL